MSILRTYDSSPMDRTTANAMYRPVDRIQFALNRDKANSVTIRGSVPEMTLERTGG